MFDLSLRDQSLSIAGVGGEGGSRVQDLSGDYVVSRGNRGGISRQSSLTEQKVGTTDN